MNIKKTGIEFGALFLTTGLLLAIGHLFKIPILMFHYKYINNEDGLYINAGSMLPIIAGLVVCYTAEKIYLYKYKKKIGQV
ncbi:hypothetical protein ACFC4S_33875 [Priestia megaterium]|uniref:hypothetical protein n=1 Tax=Priestia megaterium TaxID=1404 RepID=UPI0035DB6630